MSQQDAQIKYANWIGNTTTEKGLFSNKTFSIRSNTGFPIIIRRNPQNFQITITMENINSVKEYLNLKSEVLDSLKTYNFEHFTIQFELDSETCSLE